MAENSTTVLEWTGPRPAVIPLSPRKVKLQDAWSHALDGLNEPVPMRDLVLRVCRLAGVEDPDVDAMCSFVGIELHEPVARAGHYRRALRAVK